MVMRTIPKMSPDFFLAFLSELGGDKGITKVWIVMNEGGCGRQDFPDGRRVFTTTETHYVWKGDNGHKLWELDSEKWRYIKTLEVQWEDKSIFVTDHFTTMNLHGFYSFPDIKALPGQKPQQIVVKL
jgi:hypothetical protein